MVNYNVFLLQLQVYLLKPGGSTQEHFEKLVNLLEQFVYLHVDIYSCSCCQSIFFSFFFLLKRF